MDDASAVADLGISEDDNAFQRRTWTVERWAWWGMALLLGAAVAGLTGSGPVSQATARADGLQVTYNRIARADQTVLLSLRAAAAPGDTAQVWLSRPFLSRNEVVSLVPEPDSAAVGPDRVVYTFRRASPGSPLDVSFRMKPHEAGLAEGAVGLPLGPEVRLRQWIYP